MLICGLDEVGRGALAGPLTAVATLFMTPSKLLRWDEYEIENSPISGVDDSKKLNPVKRRAVFHRILKRESLIDFGVGEVSATEINEIGIDRANSLVFERAVKDLRFLPDFVIIDGDNPLYGWDDQYQYHEPKADGRFWPVGAASILAKVIRDDFMTELSKDYPDYGWENNAGYGSQDHMDAVRTKGPCSLHRTQFIRKILKGSTND